MAGLHIECTDSLIEEEAMLHGINVTFFISTLIAVIALILAFFIKRVKPNHEDKKDEEVVVKHLDTVKE
ncbi:hypothetical protein ACQKII_17630 [Lysinibacillus sp. NPDC048646]|uniref:hypothetical protein n=1 Tax=Lysinibacillus sp. NPDC048646 TaxID=3390574 RepID=UPI003D034FF0